MAAIYLAARFSRKDEMAGLAEQLMREGHTITSRWVFGKHDWIGTPDEQIPEDVQAEFAIDDLTDIWNADVLAVFADGPDERGSRGGKHVEVGYALGRAKKVVIVGPVENIFYSLGVRLANVLRVESVQDLRRVLVGLNGPLDGNGVPR